MFGIVVTAYNRVIFNYVKVLHKLCVNDVMYYCNSKWSIIYIKTDSTGLKKILTKVWWRMINKCGFKKIATSPCAMLYLWDG